MKYIFASSNRGFRSRSSVVRVVKLAHEGRNVDAQGVVQSLDVLLPQLWKVTDVVGTEDVPISIDIGKIACSKELGQSLSWST